MLPWSAWLQRPPRLRGSDRTDEPQAGRPRQHRQPQTWTGERDERGKQHAEACGEAVGRRDEAGGAKAAALDEEAAAEGAAEGAAASSSLDWSIMTGPEGSGGELGPRSLFGWFCLLVATNIALCSESIRAGEGDESRFSRLSRPSLRLRASGHAPKAMAEAPVGARHLAELAAAAKGNGGGCSATTAGPIGVRLAGSREGAARCGLASSVSALDSLATRVGGATRPVGRGEGAAAAAASAAAVGTAASTVAAASESPDSGVWWGSEHGERSTVVGSAMHCSVVACVRCERSEPFERTASARCCLSECGVWCDATTCLRVRRDARKRVGGAARREEQCLVREQRANDAR